MSDLTISGKIIAVFPMRSGVSKSSGKQWATQQYLIETLDQYPKRCLFEVFGEDKIREYAISVGDMADVSFDIDAREYQGKWYNSIRAWKVVKTQMTQPQQQVQQVQQRLVQQQSAAQQIQPTDFGTNYDALPF